MHGKVITRDIFYKFSISGLMLLRNDKTCHPIVLTVLGALSWIDSNASLKATQLTGPIIRQVCITSLFFIVNSAIF